MKTVLFLLSAIVLASAELRWGHRNKVKEGSCDFVDRQRLENALKEVVIGNGAQNHGLGNNMWATIVSADGEVCEVVFSGEDRFDQWRLSRVISAQKANTAASLCLPGFALSTANLFQPTQPGQFLFGLQESNPVDSEVAYGGHPEEFGSHHDPMKGGLVGGVNVFGGGLCLIDAQGTVLGGLGVSGDTSCADHFIAWRLRHALWLDFIPAGPNSVDGEITDDNIIFADDPATNAVFFAHPVCPVMGVNTAMDANSLRSELPPVRRNQP